MKKKVSIILSLVLCMMLVISACNEKSETDNNTSKTAQGTEKAESESTVKTELGEFPLVREKKSISIMIPWKADKNIEDNWLNRKYEEMTNVHVDWQTAPFDGYKEKRNIVLAGGSLPDAICGMDSYNFTAAEEMQYGSQGQLLKLNDLIEKNSIYFKGLMEKDDTIRKMIAWNDGSIYSFPRINVCYHCNFSQKMWINRVWLENLSLEMPETTDDVYHVLKAFKEKDANGNGDPDDEIPFLSPKSGWHHELDGFLMNAFCYSDAATKVAAENGKVVYTPAKDEYREGLRYINKLYKEGLIAPESFTNTTSDNSKLNMSGDRTVIGATLGGYYGMFVKKDRFTDYEIMAPIEGPDGFVMSPNFTLQRDVTRGIFAITSSAKDPALIVRWLDWFYSEEGTVANNSGEQGVDWKYAEDGDKDYNGKQAKYESLERAEDDPYYENVTLTQSIPMNTSKEFRECWVAPQDYYSDHPEAGEMQLFVRSKPYEKAAPPAAETLPYLTVSEDRVADYTRIKTELDDYTNDAIVQFITGAMDIDKDWDKFIKQLKRIGLDEYLEMSQEAYTEFLGR